MPRKAHKYATKISTETFPTAAQALKAHNGYKLTTGASPTPAHSALDAQMGPQVTSGSQGPIQFRSVQFSRSVVSNSLWPRESQHSRPPCPSSNPRVHSDSRPSSPWCHPAILCRPLLLLPPIHPSIRVFSNESTLHSACSAGDLGLTPGWGRSPGEGNDNPLQYSCLESPMDRGAWQATVHGVARVGRDLVTKPPPPAYFIYIFVC